jgi:DNA repair exonuclease SbcCD ATPase subunit
MLVSEIDLYETLKEKLGPDEAKQIVEFLKQQAQSEVRLITDEIFQKIDHALQEMKAVEEKGINITKEEIKKQIEEALKNIETIVDTKVNEVSKKLSKIDLAIEKIDGIESKIGEMNNKLDEINGKTGGVKGLMFFLWLLLIGTVIFDILLNIPSTREAILSALTGGAK